jgi:hypothetical protein
MIAALLTGAAGAVRLRAGTGAMEGFPDATNTGYTAWPGYTGSLTNYSGADPIPVAFNGTTYQGLRFNGGVAIGTAGSRPSGVTFRGCLFEATAPNFPNVQDYGTNTTFEYCTFRPASVGSPPVSFAQSYQFGVNHSGVGLTARRCEFWGFGNAIQLDVSSTATNPVTVESCYMHDAADQSHDVYHHDGILSSNGGSNVSYITIRNNTIISGGNTNAIALQVDPGTPQYYSNITATGNLLGGFGATVNIGGNGSGNTNVVFTDNTLSTLIQPVFFELYGWTDGSGNLWRRNRWLVPPGAAYGSPGDSGKYWTPSGVSTTDWTG